MMVWNASSSTITRHSVPAIIERIRINLPFVGAACSQLRAARSLYPSRECWYQAPMNELGKTLVGLGLLIALVGAALLLVGRIGLPLGRLPGDITYKSKNFSVYFPLGTSILISVIVS